MKFFACKLIVIVLSLTNLLIGMDEQTTRAIVGPITRQTSGASTSISIADSPNSTNSLTNSTCQQTTTRVPHRFRSPCPDVTQQCKCAVIAAIIVLIVFTFIPLPNHT